ncbi:MAG TPA: Wzz/FepE/Etk N-terminal domain-containing protein [Stellaceae bacterium]|nr:Wzz/FepE/Etk N-terminal domain-containing protein [Stellaceae bacterium]
MAANPYDLTTREVLSILFKERRKLLGAFLGLAVGVIAYSYLLTPYYDATGRLLVKTGREFQVRSDPTQPVASVPSTTKQEIVNSEIQILTSRDLVLAVINRIGAAKLYPGGGLLSFLGSAAPSADAAVKSFYSDFKVAPVEQSDVIAISYRNANREMAVQALNMVVELYQQKHAEMFSDPRYKFLGQQAQQYEDQLAAQVKKVAELKSTQSLFDVETQRAKLLDDRAAVNSILQQLKSQAIDTHQRIEFLQSRLKSTPALVPAGGTTSDVVEQAKDRLLDLEVKRQQLSERYVGNVKPLQDNAAEMAHLKSFLARPDGMKTKAASQRNAAYDDMVVALNRALADAAPIDRQLALRKQEAKDIETRLAALVQASSTVDNLERERRELEELAHTYRSRYEEARMSEDLDREKIVSVSVVQKPDAPMKPTGPQHLPFALAGILIGLVGSAGVLVYLLVFRETLITVESVERMLGLPVLASVAARRRRERATAP